MILSKSCIYGIRATTFLALAEQDCQVSIREVSDALNISFHYLTKIFQKLSENDMVISSRGAFGGVRLKRIPANITLMEVVLAIDGPALFETCILGLKGCGVMKPCPLHDQWFSAVEILKSAFNETTLMDLADQVVKGEARITESNNPDFKMDIVHSKTG